MNLWCKSTLIRQRRQIQGFSLLETLVAFSILSLSLGVMFQIYSRGTRITSLSRDYADAVIVAETELARLDAESKFEPGTISKTVLDRFTWQRNVTAYEDPHPAQFKTSYALVKVEVKVSWITFGQPHSLTLRTMRMSGIN